jgi:hypothetical protein
MATTKMVSKSKATSKSTAKGTVKKTTPAKAQHTLGTKYKAQPSAKPGKKAYGK